MPLDIFWQTNLSIIFSVIHSTHCLSYLKVRCLDDFFFSSRPSELAREQAWVFVCGASVRMSTQAWVFTLEVPISSWRWQESMSWLSSNELLQQNLSATFSLCLTLFFFPPPHSQNLPVFSYHPLPCSVPASPLLISTVFLFFFPYYPPFSFLRPLCLSSCFVILCGNLAVLL